MTRAHGAADADARVVALALRATVATTCRRGSSTSCPADGVERERLRPSSWSGYGAAAPSQVTPREDVPSLATGDSVRHGTLGEGVVDRDRARRRRHRPVRGRRQRAAADARLRAAREGAERLEIRPCEPAEVREAADADLPLLRAASHR